MSKPNFKRDLGTGQQGETAFHKLFSRLQKTDGRKGDFVAPDGSVIELKTDMYGMQKTPNFFIERFSSLETQSPGGPWQAKAHGCEFFVYFYLPDKVGYVWLLGNLLPQLEALISQLKPVEVKNVRWTTIGYKVPRDLLAYDAKFSLKGKDDNFGLISSWTVGPDKHK